MEGVLRRLPSAGGIALVVALLAALAMSASPSSAFACENAGARPGSISTHDAGRAVICLLNNERTRRGLGTVKSNNKLDDAALDHSNYMAVHNCFDHVCPGEADIISRLRAYLSGALAWAYGENIAWGQGRLGSPKNMVSAWMHSPEHRVNVLNPDFDQIGVGVVWASPVPSRVVSGTYTTDFGFTSH